MPNPTVTNGSFATVTSSTTTVSWSHTAEANRTIYVYIAGLDEDTTGTAVESCTFDGVAMKALFRAGTIFGAQGRAVYLFSIINPTAGAHTILFTSTITSNWSGHAFNVLDGPVDGSAILPGLFQQGSTTTLTKKGYGWDPNGVLICVAGYTSASLTLSGGTQIASGGQLVSHYINTADTEYSFTTTRSNSSTLTLFSFLIPHVTQTISGGEKQIWFSGLTDLSGLTVNSSIEAGLPFGNEVSGAVGGYGRIGNIITVPGTIRSIAAHASIPAGSGNEVTLELVRGSSSNSTSNIGQVYAIPTGITLTIGGASDTSALLDSVDLSFYRYEQLAWKIKNTGAGTIPSGLRISTSLLFEAGSDAPNEQVYGGGAMSQTSSTVDQASNRAMLHPMGSNVWGAISQQDKSVVKINLTVNEMLVKYQDSVTVNPDHQYYMIKNGTKQDGTGGTVDTTATLVADSMGQALARSRFTLTYAPGDFTGHVGYRRTGGGTLRQAACVRVTPTTTGQMIVSGTTDQGPTGSNHIASPVSDQEDLTTTLGDESKFAIIVPPLFDSGASFSVLGMYNKLENVGPSPGSWSNTLRKNSVDAGMTPLTISGSATTGETSGNVPYVEGDLISILWDATGSPTALYQFYTLVGFLAPAVGTIIVEKYAGGNATAIFGFVASGGLSPGSFNLVGGAQQIINDVTPGSGYGIVETPASGWQQDSVSVSNGSPINDISVDTGETVEILFTNSLIAPANNPSGLYVLVPGKTNDTMWIDVDLNVTEDVKIP